jgi:hypothetical protein
LAKAASERDDPFAGERHYHFPFLLPTQRTYMDASPPSSDETNREAELGHISGVVMQRWRAARHDELRTCWP